MFRDWEVDGIDGGRCLSLQHFVKSDDAGAALSALDDSEFMGSHIQVQVREATAVVGPVFDSTAIFICVTIVYVFFVRIVLAPCVTCCESLTIPVLLYAPFADHQMARTKGHGYGRGSGPPRPRGGRGLVSSVLRAPTHDVFRRVTMPPYTPPYTMSW